MDSCLPFWTVGTDNHWSIHPLLGLLEAFIWMLLFWSGLRAVPSLGGIKTQTMLFGLAGAHVKPDSYFVIVLKLLPFRGSKLAFFFLLLEVWLNTSQTPPPPGRALWPDGWAVLRALEPRRSAPLAVVHQSIGTHSIFLFSPFCTSLVAICLCVYNRIKIS